MLAIALGTDNVLKGEHGYELEFYAGDIINVTEIDEASGWWTGELNGAVGPFPGNYVNKM